MLDITAEKSFDLNQTHDYILSIRISPDGFSFSVIHSSGNKLLAFKSTPIKISHEKFITRRFTEWLDTQEITGKNFRHTEILFYTEKFVLIPETCFVSEKSAAIFHHLFENTIPFAVLDNQLVLADARLLFSVPKQLNQFLQSRFENVPILHPLQKIATMFSPSENESRVVLYLTPQSFCMLLFKNSRLVFANSFVVSTPADIAYFVVTVLNQERLTREETVLYLTGDRLQVINAESVLQHHFSSVVLPDLNPDVLFPPEIQVRPDYPLFILTGEV